MYLKDYLESNNMSQTEFALRLGITQKHINEIINGKTNITLALASNIEKLTGINANFILQIENYNETYEYINKLYNNNPKEIKKDILSKYNVNELIKRDWVRFRDIDNIYAVAVDLMKFMRIKNFDIIDAIEEKVMFKKKGENFIKLNLWLSRCDALCENQPIGIYDSQRFNELIKDVKKVAYEKNINELKLQELLNRYGIFFVCEKALSGTKVRGAFKVKGKAPAIYITKNYVGKDSFYFELLHELGHLKADFNTAKNKVIIDGDQEKEKKADKFALNVMMDKKLRDEISMVNEEKELLRISKEYKIPMSFIVGSKAKMKQINYSSELYNKYKLY